MKLRYFTIPRYLRACFGAVLAINSLLAVCRAQTSRDRKVDVGGYQLHISESGSGTPVVVFESGLGEDVGTWSDVQPEVARFARTFAYDRAGLGKSDPSPHSRTVENMAVELRTVLHAAKLKPRYVLVGHSLGGTIVQIFAHSYPMEVAGLVLIDPEDGRLDEMLYSHMTARDWADRQKAIEDAMPKMPTSVKAEMDAYQKSGKAASEVFPLPDVLTILLTGTKINPEFPGNPLEQDLKLQLHNDILGRIPNSRHVLVPTSRHYIQNDAPRLVIEAIHAVISRNDHR